MEAEMLSYIARGGIFVVSISVFIWTLHTMGFDFFNLIERKRSGKHLFSTEKQSKKRVQAILSDVTSTPKEKCLCLNHELGRIMNSVFVSREWKDTLHNQITAIMQENDLKMADFF